MSQVAFSTHKKCEVLVLPPDTGIVVQGRIWWPTRLTSFLARESDIDVCLIQYWSMHFNLDSGEILLDLVLMSSPQVDTRTYRPAPAKTKT